MTKDATSSKPYTLLYVEDNPAEAEILARDLRTDCSPAFALDHVDNLAAAISRLACGDVDVALVDLTLPDSSGVETFEAMHAAAPAVPIVILTGSDEEHLVVEMLRQGAQDYLLKSEVKPKLLARALRFAIERQRNAALETCIEQLGAAQELLKKKNRRLAKLHRTAHQFVENVSHEFRTPLTVIKDYVALVRDGVMGPVSDEQEHMLTVAEDRADDLNIMVDDMLDVSTLEAGLLSVNRSKCQVSEIVDRVWPALERKAAVRGVQLECEIDASAPAVFCDPEKACRVLVNLTTNAIKFCGQPGRVRLNCRRQSSGTGVRICVRDNGNGIGVENQKAVFRRFKQLDESSRFSTKGFGLGLNIAKELAELNLGEIRLKSRVGHGSTFSFTLPEANPAVVLRRYLARVERVHNGSSQVTLVEAAVDDTASAPLVEDASEFMASLLNASDLLLPMSSARWLVVLPVGESEIAAFGERVAKEAAGANRNRVNGPLPAIRLEVLGSWRATGNRDVILERASAAFECVPA